MNSSSAAAARFGAAGRVLLSVLMPAVVVAGTIRQSLHFSQADLQISYADGYAIPTLPGCEQNWAPGKPTLPVALVRVLLPSDAQATAARVATSASTEIEGEYLVCPVQQPRPVSSTEKVRFTPEDIAVYSSAQVYPGQSVELLGTGDKAGFRIADLTVYPLRYEPQQRRLLLSTELAIEVDYRTVTDRVVRIAPAQYGAAERGVKALVSNPQQIAEFGPPVRSDDPVDLNYAIITSQQLAAAFDPLLAWHHSTGLTTDVKSREWIAANYPGVDAQEQIRNFIKDYYEHHGLAYVLLAGDTQVVPCRRGRATATPYVDDLPTDLYYADLQWSWDGDHDGIWGEFGDDTVDFYSDVYIGRVPVDDSVQARAFVEKVMGYELNPEIGYQTKILLPYTALYSFYGGRLAQDSIAAFVPRTWQVATFTGMTTTGPISDSIEAGFGLAHIVAHGNSTGMYTMGGQAVYSAAAAGLQTNRTRLPVVTSIACHTGNFESSDCLAEALMNNANGGAVAAIMNSRYGIAQPPGCGPAEKLDIRFYEYLLQLDSFELGPAHSASKDFYAGLARSGGIWQWSVYELNLFGDPRMPVWTAQPRTLAASYPAVLYQRSQDVVIAVFRNSFPCPGARVRLAKTGDFEVSDVTGSDGRVRLVVNPQSTGRFHITVQAENGIPFVDSGLVRDSGVCIGYARHALVDSPPAGNGDGIANPGETIALRVWLVNTGTALGRGITAHLSTSDSGAILLDSVADCGSILPGDSALSRFRFWVAVRCTNDYLIPFRLTARDIRDSLWFSQLAVLIGTSVLRYGSVSVADPPPGGNGNQRLDPGETAQLVATIFNSGYGNGYAVAGRLAPADARLTVQDSLADFGFIAHGGSGDNTADPLVLVADSLIPPETCIPCTLAVRAQGEPERGLPFSLPVGQIRASDPVPDTGGTSHRYFAYDNEDTAYRACPAYNWVEIRGTEDLHLEHEMTVQKPLPFTVQFFGRSNRTVSICSNGWLAMGTTTARNWNNRELPDGLTPNNLICPNWDHLYPDSTGGGTVWFHFDSSGHRFIVEWDSVVYRDTMGARDKFEVIIYDSTIVTPTGDNEIIFQYQTANNYGSSTIGIENDNSSIGIDYLFDSSYHRAAATIVPGRAIRITTSAPSSVQEQHSAPLPRRLDLRAASSVSASGFSISYTVSAGQRAELAIYDLVGRRVCELVSVLGDAKTHEQIWNGCDDQGRPVRTGLYFCALLSASESRIQKLVLTR